ncbi:MAG: sugar phosphate isomerase/epimerase family protein [Candidatus Hydrogenedentota bacterium]
MKTRHSVVLAVVLIGVTAVSGGAVGEEGPMSWRVGPTAWTFKEFSFFEAVDKTASLDLSYIEAFQGQRVRPDSEQKLDVTLPDEALEAIRDKLEEADVTLVSIYIGSIPGEEEACRRTFEFERELGIEFIVSEPHPDALDVIERFCNEYEINVAIHNHPEGKSRYWSPEAALEACEGRGPRIGVCADTGHWLRSGLEPTESVRKLGDRLMALHLKDLDKAAPDGKDRPWGQGCGELEKLLRTIHELGQKPALFGIEYESNWQNNMPQVRECAEWFRKTVSSIAVSDSGECDEE